MDRLSSSFPRASTPASERRPITLSDLPLELLSHILSFLPFRELSTTYQIDHFWKDITRSFAASKANASIQSLLGFVKEISTPLSDRALGFTPLVSQDLFSICSTLLHIQKIYMTTQTILLDNLNKLSQDNLKILEQEILKRKGLPRQYKYILTLSTVCAGIEEKIRNQAFGEGIFNEIQHLFSLHQDALGLEYLKQVPPQEGFHDTALIYIVCSIDNRKQIAQRVAARIYNEDHKLLSLCQIEASQGNIETAENALNRIHDPRIKSQGHLCIMDQLAEQGNREDLRERLSILSDEVSQNQSITYICTLLTQEGKVEEALEMALTHSSITAITTMIDELIRQGENETAVKLLKHLETTGEEKEREAIQKDMSRRIATSRIVQAFAKKGEIDRAKQLVSTLSDDSLESLPMKDKALLAIIKAYLQRGDLPAAEELFKTLQYESTQNAARRVILKHTLRQTASKSPG